MADIQHDFSTGVATNATVGVTSTLALAANEARKYCILINDSDEEIYLSLGSTAVLNKGIRLNRKGGLIEIGGDKPFRGAIYAISTTGSKNLSIYYA